MGACGTSMRWVLAMLALVAGMMAVMTPATIGAQGNSDAARACQKGGYTSLTRADGTRFATVGECVSYAARGGTLLEPGISLSFESVGSGACLIVVTLTSFPANSSIPVDIAIDNGEAYSGTLRTDDLGYASGAPIGTYIMGSGITASAGGLSTGEQYNFC